MARNDGSLLITNATLIDGTGAAPVRDTAILVEGERIAYAGTGTRLGARSAARTIDATGMTVIPGLIDTHIHSTFDSDMRVYLKNGVTTIRFAGLNQDAVVTLRDRIARGEIPGPRIYSCGPMLDKTPPAYPKWTSPVNTPAEAKATARRLLAEDKVEALLVTQQITPDLMRPIVETAHEFGRPVVGQIWYTDGREAAEIGIDQLDNSSRIFASREYPKERLLTYRSIPERLLLLARAWTTVDWDLTRPIMEAMVRRSVSYCPTLVVLQNQAGVGREALEADEDYRTMYGEKELAEWAAFVRYMQGSASPEERGIKARAAEVLTEWMRRFRAMGGDIVLGTDMQFGGIVIHRELKNLEATGMSPLEVITAATGASARAMRVADSLGTVRAGMLADLVVLRRDPLRDLGAARDIAHVIKGGTIVQV